MNINKNNLLLKNINRKRKQVGRGLGSGRGKHCGRGMNGQKCRSGYNFNKVFEGGQHTLARRVRKYGFFKFKKQKNILTIDKINATFKENTFINIELLKKHNLINLSKVHKKHGFIIKILCNKNNKNTLKNFIFDKKIKISKNININN